MTRRLREAGPAEPSEGNVEALTTHDRQTGRADLTASAEATLRLPAGSRGKSAVPPFRGAEGGEAASPSSLAPSSVHTLATKSTSQDSPGTHPNRIPIGVRSEWLEGVEDETKAHRDQKVRRHRLKAQAARVQGQESTATWHEQRANGEQLRFERVRECGARIVESVCGGCGQVAPAFSMNCRQPRLCLYCRRDYAEIYRQRFREGRARAIREVRSLLFENGIRGKWTEKFITFTLPHGDNVADDVRVLYEAWLLLWRKVRHHLRTDRGVPKELVDALPYARVTEIAPGRKKDGHAHFHVYTFSPYLHHEVLRRYWGEALESLGRRVPEKPIEEVLARETSVTRRRQLQRFLRARRSSKELISEVPWPVVDITQCDQNIDKEFAKYLIKDAEYGPDGLALIDVKLFGRFYEGLDGRRLLATSRHFWNRDDRAVPCCACCGSSDLRRRMRDSSEGDP